MVYHKAYKTMSGLYSDSSSIPLINLLGDKRIFPKYRVMVARYDSRNYYHDSFRRVSLHADRIESDSIITRAKSGFVVSC